MYVHFPRVSGHCLRGMLLSYPTWNTEGTVIDVPPMDNRNKKKGHGLTATDAANLDRSPVPLTATLSIKSLARSIARTRSPSWVSPSQRGQTAALPNYKAKPIPPPSQSPASVLTKHENIGSLLQLSMDAKNWPFHNPRLNWLMNDFFFQAKL